MALNVEGLPDDGVGGQCEDEADHKSRLRLPAVSGTCQVNSLSVHPERYFIRNRSLLFGAGLIR